MHDIYCLSHNHFDYDMTICCLFVNEGLDYILRHDNDLVYWSNQSEQIHLLL
jgi:hypothetical protein